MTDCTCCFTAPCSLTLTPSQTHSLSSPYHTLTHKHSQAPALIQLPHSSGSAALVRRHLITILLERTKLCKVHTPHWGIHTNSSRAAHFKAFLDFVKKEACRLKRSKRNFWATFGSETYNITGCKKSQKDDEAGTHFGKCLGQP